MQHGQQNVTKNAVGCVLLSNYVAVSVMYTVICLNAGDSDTFKEAFMCIRKLGFGLCLELPFDFQCCTVHLT